MIQSLLEQEAREVPSRIALQLEENDHTTDKLGSHLRLVSPKFIYIVGRGSSDHAGYFAKYLFETETGIPVVSATPSVSTVYGKTVKLQGALVLLISQSGRSADVLEQAKMAKRAGAYTVGLINDENSPLCELCDVLLPLKAGKQNAIGATKTLLMTMSALIQLAAKWSHNKALIQSLNALPDLLQQAIDAPPMLLPEKVANIKHCAVLGRGFGYAVAREITMKLMGICGIHAEPFSSAEFLHGGIRMAEQELTIFSIMLRDEAFKNHRNQMHEFTEQGLVITPIEQPVLKVPDRLAPLIFLQRFYLDVALIAKSRGIDPDNPPGIQKMTKTL
ncbi:glucosamine-6-phosphate deaminase NagB-II [Algibacillus agarilyticus]|uniref:glucosamine-6-phosphate deaminase NagB-II n=1 Tax=Algibacillus agarilyticus TaxID=2234133 RepID=UPI000DCFF6B3|nr:SIS domain-containing protein [Algibacillus agarilyticus]